MGSVLLWHSLTLWFKKKSAHKKNTNNQKGSSGLNH